MKTLNVSARQELIRKLSNPDTPPAELTYAAEIAGTSFSADYVVPILLKLLDHESPLVREGALLGLTTHTALSDVFDKTLEMLKTDDSPGVRETAKENLDNFYHEINK